LPASGERSRRSARSTTGNFHVSSLQLAYERGSGAEAVNVIVNASQKTASVRIADASIGDSAARWVDLLSRDTKREAGRRSDGFRWPPTWLGSSRDGKRGYLVMLAKKDALAAS
jgi:hypothetical protein